MSHWTVFAIGMFIGSAVGVLVMAWYVNQTLNEVQQAAERTVRLLRGLGEYVVKLKKDREA